MEVRDISAAAETAARTASRQRAAPERAETESRPPSQPASDMVEISTRGDAVVERHGAAEAAAKAAGGQGEGDHREGRENPGALLTRDVRRDYTVDNGGLVVKVIDKKEDEVIREIPPEEQRRIKEAMSRIAEENLEKRVQDDGPGEHVDVTS